MAFREIEVEKDEVWTMRDGTEVKVGDMSVEHVRNTLRMLLRKQREMKEVCVYLEKKRWEASLDVDIEHGNGGW